MKKKKLPLSVKIALVLAFAALVFVALMFLSGIRETLDALGRMKFWILAPVLGLSLGNYLVRFGKWHFYCGKLDIDVSAWTSFLIFMSGLSMSVSPGKFGEVIKSVLLKKVTGTNISVSAPIVVAERVTDLAALLALSAGAMFFLEFKGFYEIARIVLIAVSALTFLLIVAMSSRHFASAFCALLGKLPLIKKISHKVDEAFASICRLVTPVNFLLMTVLSVFSWGFECAGFYLVLWSLGVEGAFTDYGVFVYTFSLMIGAVSMLPGGLGLTEFGMVGMLVRFKGIGGPLATAITFVIRACTLWFATIVGALFLIAGSSRFRMKMSEIEELDTDGLVEREAENPAC